MPESINVVTQTVRLQLSAKTASWTDTGIVITPGDGLHLIVEGTVKADKGEGYLSYPEGTYNSSDPDQTEDLGAVVQFEETGRRSSSYYPASNTRPNCVSMVLWPEGNTPGFARPGIDTAIATNRDYMSNPVPNADFEGESALRVWLIFNDRFGTYSDNAGAFSVTVEKLAISAITLPPARGGRTLSPAYLSLLQAQTQHPAWCWSITPISGEREFYTSLDVPLDLEAFTSANGENEIPAATYLPGHGVDLSALPTTLKIETDGTDVSVLNFNRLRLLGGYYFGADVEVFEVDFENLAAGRWVAFAGRMGNAVIGDLNATVELASWDDLIAKKGADVVVYTCPHRFCEGICRNQTLEDGPSLSDWTRVGTVVAVLASTKIRIELDPGFLSNGTRETALYSPSERLLAWQNRLSEGKIKVTGEPEEESVNLNLSRQIKLAGQISADLLDFELRQSFVAPPAVGTVVEVSSGCVKTPARCKEYSNFANYGGFPFLPLADGVKRK